MYNILTTITIISLTQIRGIARKWKSKIYKFAMNKIIILMIGIIMTSIKYDNKEQFKFQVYQHTITLINGFYNYSRAYTTAQEPIIK
jgi:hypothetical protein